MTFKFKAHINYDELPVNRKTVDKVSEREDEFVQMWTQHHPKLGFGPMLIEWLRQHPEDLTA
jgi:hypothetical protein